MCFFMDERAALAVEYLSILRNYDLHIWGNSVSRFRVLRTQFGTAEDRRSRHFDHSRHQACPCCSHDPSQKAPPAARHIFFQPVLQAPAEAQWDFKHTFVAVQLDHIARAIQHRGAPLAAADVLLQCQPQAGLDVAFKVVRNLAPNIFAVNYHGFVPFSKDNRLLQLPPNPGASRSRSISRARSNRVLTDPVLMPSACAVSSMLRCCMSRSTNTSRYFPPSAASPSESNCRTSLRSSVSDGISRQSAKSQGV